MMKNIISAVLTALLLVTGAHAQMATNGAGLSITPPAGVPASACDGVTIICNGTTVVVPYANIALFGTGADGNVTCSGASTLARDMMYANLTVSAGCAIKTNGYRVYVSGTLDLSAAPAGAINWNGNVGTAAVGAAGGSAGTVMSGVTVPAEVNGGSPVSGAGGTGNTTTGTPNPIGSTGSEYVLGGVGGNGGTGGTGVSAGAAGGAAGGFGFATGVPMPNPLANFFIYDFRVGQLATPISGSAGGGGGQGGGDGANAGGGGGAGSRPGGTVYVACNTIARGSNATAGIITANGGAGQNGANGVAGTAGGGAGGGGGGGGFVYIVAGSLTGNTITGALAANGGAGGNGGNGASTGAGGAGGSGGRSGNIQIVVLSPSSFTNSTGNAAGNAGNAASGSTGGTGGLTKALAANL